MNPTENISQNEYEALLKFPAYVTLLGAASDSKLDDTTRKSAIEFSHIKTYSCDPLLTSFYAEADKIFEQNMLQLDRDLPVEKDESVAAIKKEMADLEKILVKMGSHYTVVMHRSMHSFKEHVSNAHHNVFADFVFQFQ